MAPKKRSSTARIANLKKTKKEKDVDNEFYVVEEIRSNRLEERTLNYTVKWENWDEKDNTDEPEPRLLCDRKLLDFAKRTLSGVNPDFENEMKYLDINNTKKFLKILDPFAIIAQASVLTGTVKFINWDSLTTKLMFLNYLREFKQTYLLYSYKPVSDNELDRSFDEYQEQFRHRLEIFPETPLVEFRFPMEGRAFFYAPPPLSDLLFEPVDKHVFDVQPKHFFPLRDTTKLGFNQAESFIHHSYFQIPSSAENVKYSKSKKIGGMKRLNFEERPRFKTNLVMRQETCRGWVLRVANPVKENTPLLMMTGVIRPESVAHQALITQGERVAFSSFINIPKTGYCLDRRQYHDFSKYIGHSCNPSCSVRLVESGNAYPDLVVYSTRELSVECDISLDYFKGFDVVATDGMLFEFYDQYIDFVQCQCASLHCRQILYVDRSLSKADYKKNKKEKLEDLDPAFTFGGMQVAESFKIWTITNQEFDN